MFDKCRDEWHFSVSCRLCRGGGTLLLGYVGTVLSVAGECIQLEEHDTAGPSICVWRIIDSASTGRAILTASSPRDTTTDRQCSEWVQATGFCCYPGELRNNTGAHFIVFQHARCPGSRSSCEAYSRREFGVRFYLAAYPTLLHRTFESNGFLAAMQGHDKKDTLLFNMGHNHLLPIFRPIQHCVTYAAHRALFNTFLQHRFDFRRRHMINTFVITR